MSTEQIQALVTTGAFPGAAQPVEWLETHISWVILTPDFAFKVKKPVTFGFLDFGTLDKRRHFCQEELRLNSRLAPDVYLGVLPIAEKNGQPAIGYADAPPIDYALQMRRLDNARQMDRVLAAGQVSAEHLEALAEVLVPFHRRVAMPDPPVCHAGAYWADFAELYRLGADIERHLGSAATAALQRWRSHLPEFLEQHSERLAERARSGLWVDGHGDLHAKNMFLLESGPVVFDCIEFSDHFRQGDILNELAFLCMDLEAQGHPELSDAFLQAYRRRWDVFPKPEDAELFRFFKAYRANIRLKVALLERRQHASPALEAQIRRYWEVLSNTLAAN